MYFMHTLTSPPYFPAIGVLFCCCYLFECVLFVRTDQCMCSCSCSCSCVCVSTETISDVSRYFSFRFVCVNREEHVPRGCKGSRSRLVGTRYGETAYHHATESKTAASTIAYTNTGDIPFVVLHVRFTYTKPY